MNESNETKETEVSSSESTRQEGGYDYEVVDTRLFDEFYCSVCHKLKRNAVELNCQHSLCSSCLDQWELKADEMKIEFNCPQCRQSIDKGMRQYSGTMNRIIQTSIQIKCTNFSVGCDWIGVIADIQEHIDRICKYTVINCTFTECGVYVQRKELDKHLKGCAYRPVSCIHCSDGIIWINLKKHHLSECRLFPVTCSNEGCQEIIAKEKVHLHETNQCSFTKIACQYASVGCLVKFLRCDEEDHEKNSTATHMSLLFQDNLSVRKDLQETKSQLQTTKTELQATKTELQSAKSKLIETQEKMIGTENCLKTSKEEIKQRFENDENCINTTLLKLKNTENNLEDITKHVTAISSWQQLNSSIGFEVKSLVELFQDDIDTKLRKCEESYKMFKISVEELQKEITVFLSNWSYTIPNIKTCLDLQSKALEIFSNCELVDFKAVSEYHVSRSNLLKHTEVEDRAKLFENHQNIVDLHGANVHRLNKKLEPCILNSFKDCDMLIVDPYVIIKCSNYHAMDAKIFPPSYYFKMDILWQQVNNGKCELFCRDVADQNVDTNVGTDGFMVLKLFPELFRKHLNAELKECEEFETLTKTLQTALQDYLNGFLTLDLDDIVDKQLEAFDCFSKRPFYLMRSSIQYHMSRFILPDCYEKYLWKYVRKERLDEDHEKMMLKQQSIINTLAENICQLTSRLNSVVTFNARHDGFSIKYIVMGMESIDCLDALYYFYCSTVTRQMDGKWVTFNSNGYTHETLFPFEMNADDKIYMVYRNQ